MNRSKYNRRPNGTTNNEILEIIRLMPGLTSTEIAELMPHVKKTTIAPAVHMLKNLGAIKTEGHKLITCANGKPKPVPTYVLSNEPTSNVVKMKQREPTEVGLRAQLESLKVKVSELEAWKADAIARYPDLAVDPVVLKARKLVASELRTSGDTNLASEVEAGRKDSTLMMRVTIKALEETDV